MSGAAKRTGRNRHGSGYMRSFIEDILYDRRTDAVTLPVRAALRFLEGFYSAGTAIRNFLYDRNILKSDGVPCRVVSVGNVTVGGSGKTPVVVMAAKLLVEAGYPVAVVSRGYGGRTRIPLVVSDEARITALPAECGDEPHIIAQELTGVPVVVGKNRLKAAQLAFERFKPKVILLDDAFQHRKLERNVDIVTIDADSPFGNEHLLPRGTLRESPFALKRAKAVVATHLKDEKQMEKVERMVRYYDRRVPIFRSRYAASGFRKPGGDEKSDPGEVKGVKVAALSNIATPASFHRTLESLGAVVVLKKTMPDHHRYTAGELESIENDALSAGAEMLVMTAKDERNLPEPYGVERIDKRVLDIEAELLDDREKFLKLLKPLF